MMGRRFPIFPKFLLRYNFETFDYLKTCDMPITLFHGDNDQVIPFESSEMLTEHLGNKVDLVRLGLQGHNGITHNPDYQAEVKNILSK